VSVGGRYPPSGFSPVGANRLRTDWLQLPSATNKPFKPIRRSSTGVQVGIRYPFRVPGPTKYRSYWFCAPTLPLAVSSAAWFFLAGLRRPQLSDRRALSSDFAFLQSLAQRNLVPGRSRTTPLLGFASLQHSRVRRSTPRGRPSPLRSAFRVWLPSWRLTPAEPLPAFFHAGGALGIHPSELSPLGRYPPRFRGEEPTYRFSRR
jgi:hypothetical protein